MDGRVTIAVKILTIVLMLRALMERLALMALEILHVDVRPARRAYCVIWMMRALRIRVMPTQFAKPVQSMGRSRVHVHKAIKDQTVLKISMNVSKVNVKIIILNNIFNNF
jgi:hypothetical protein